MEKRERRSFTRARGAEREAEMPNLLGGKV